jgi:hypothetical protein
MAYASAKASHKEEALSVVRQLEKQRGFQHRDFYAYFRADITLGSLRSDPRYADLFFPMSMPR